jgi:hypothetical protein
MCIRDQSTGEGLMVREKMKVFVCIDGSAI